MAKDLSYDELVQLRQSGVIGWNEFVLRSVDGDDYEAWLDDNGLAASDDNARLFLEEREGEIQHLQMV